MPCERARRRERLDLLVLEVGADDRRRDRRRRLGDDLHRLGDAGGLQRDVLLDGEAERHGGVALHGRETAQLERDAVARRAAAR